MKNKLALFDLDGTLFDTRQVNYRSYQKALEEYGFQIDYPYFSAKCNGRHYKDFLPIILGNQNTDALMEGIHRKKKAYYPLFLSEVAVNQPLFSLIDAIRNSYYIALVTTASRKNTEEILSYYHKDGTFDLWITQEDVQKKKPDPEGFLKAMRHFGISPENTIIFEDSEVGIEAATRSGGSVYVVKGYG